MTSVFSKRLNLGLAAILIAVLLSIVPLTGALVLGDAMPISGPIVLQLTGDSAVKDSAEQIARFVDGAHLLRVSNMLQLELISRKAVGPVFYASHGMDEGLEIDGKVVRWETVRNIVRLSPAEEHYFAVCFSSRIGRMDGKTALGFEGEVDADVAALVLSIWWHCERYYETRLKEYHMMRVGELLAVFVQTGCVEKAMNPARPLTVTPWGIGSYWQDTVLIGLTPYGVVNPPALRTHYSALDVDRIIDGTLGLGVFLTLLTAVLRLSFTGPIAAAGLVLLVVVTALIALMGVSVGYMAKWDRNADGSIDQWIPMDPANLGQIVLGGIWFCKTPHAWWWGRMTFMGIWCPA
jgi:hypothetical protein